MGLMTDWRNALIPELEEAFPGALVAAGERTGVSRDRDRINVFPGGWSRDGGRAVVANPIMLIRYWPKRSKQPASDVPHDPTELDDARDAMLTALRPLQATLGVTNLWYFLVDSAEVDEDPDEWGVEFRLRGFGKNTATIA